jgi:hypothetical protein
MLVSDLTLGEAGQKIAEFSLIEKAIFIQIIFREVCKDSLLKCRIGKFLFLFTFVDSGLPIFCFHDFIFFSFSLFCYRLLSTGSHFFWNLIFLYYYKHQIIRRRNKVVYESPKLRRGGYWQLI